MSEPAPCPPLETLASFAEGGLGEPARGEVVTHLELCPRCRETAAETIAARAALAEALAQGRARGRTPLGYAAAAAAVVIVGLTMWWSLRPEPAGPATSRRTARTIATMALSLEAAATIDSPGVLLPPEPHRASYGFSDAVSPAGVAFHTGRNLLRLQITLSSGDREGAAQLAGRIATLMGRIEEDGSRWIELRTMAEKVQTGEIPVDRAPFVQLATSLAGEAPHGAIVALGARVEIGRIAAARADATLLGDEPAIGPPLAAELPSGARRILEEIESAGAPREARDWRRLGRMLDDLVELM